MFNPLNIFRRNIEDDAKDFTKDYPVVSRIILLYLQVWFKQSFTTGILKDAFESEPEMYKIMASEVRDYLLCTESSIEENPRNSAYKEQIEMAKNYRQKWVDDALRKDNDFCKLIIQTLRLETVYNSYYRDLDWSFKDEKGKKIAKVLAEYGSLVPECPDPKRYNKLVNKWILWANNMIKEHKDAF